MTVKDWDDYFKNETFKGDWGQIRKHIKNDLLKICRLETLITLQGWVLENRNNIQEGLKLIVLLDVEMGKLKGEEDE